MEGNCRIIIIGDYIIFMLLNLTNLFHKIYDLFVNLSIIRRGMPFLYLRTLCFFLLLNQIYLTNHGIAQEGKKSPQIEQQGKKSKTKSQKNDAVVSEESVAPAVNHKEITQSIKDQVTAWSQGNDVKMDASPKSKTENSLSTSLPSSEEQNEESLKKISTHLTVGLTKDNTIKIDLLFKLGTPFFSVFSRNKTWYVVLSHPSDFEKAPYNPNDYGDLEGISTLEIEGGFVIKISLNKRQFPTIEYDEKADSIHLSFFSKPPEDDRRDDIHLPKSKDASFRVHQENGRVDLDFYDDDSTYVWAICASGKNLPLRYRPYPEFNLLESYQGVAFELISEHLIKNFHNKKVVLSKVDGLAVSPEQTKYEAVQKTTSLFTGFDVEKSPEEIIRLTQLAAANPQPLREYFEMAYFYIGLDKIPEATSIVNRLKESSSDLQLIPVFGAMDGLCQLLLDRFGKAEEILDPLSCDPEPQFWMTLAQASKNLFISSVESKRLPEFKESLLLMPQSLREALLIKVLLAGIYQRDKDILQAFTEKSLEPKDSINKSYYKLAKILFHMIQDSDYSTQEMHDLTKFSLDPRVATIAEFEMVKLRPTLADQDPSNEFKALESLCYKWRGDILEYQINTYLASRYIERKKFHLALPIYRRMIKFFDKLVHEDNLSQKMKDALISYFKQDPFPPVLEALSILQEYGDIAPDSQEGDDMILRATNPLVQLDLYDEALGIIQKYLDTKCKEESTGDNADLQDRRNGLFYRIGVIHFLNDQPQDSLNVLKKIKNPKPSVNQEVSLLKAECYNDLKDLQGALGVLGDSLQELIRKASIYFTHEKWSEAADVYRQILGLREKNIDAVSLEIAQTVLLDLALCYASLKQVEQLKQLKEKYLSIIKDTKVHSAFEFLTADLSFDNVHEISGAKLSEMTQVKGYADNLKKIFSDK